MQRRLRTLPVLFAGAVVATLLAPLWLPAVVVADLLRGRVRLPLTRLGAFGVCWAWIEVAGVLAAFADWARGRAHDPAAQYHLMQWWAATLMRCLERTVGFEPRLDGADALDRGNAIVLARHASLADSLLSAWAVRVESDLWPRYVLKRELRYDPCLDIVGHRIPNHFLDRAGGDEELAALQSLTAGMSDHEVAVIFPEGTRSNPAKRERALNSIRRSDPERAERLSALRQLLPPRPGGAAAMLTGAPEADVVLAWHTGFDGLDTFGGIVSKLSRPLPPVRFVARRVAREHVPDPAADPAAFARWLDDQWLQMDSEVASALANTA